LSKFFFGWFPIAQSTKIFEEVKYKCFNLHNTKLTQRGRKKRQQFARLVFSFCLGVNYNTCELQVSN